MVEIAVYKDADALPGEAQSWAPGEPIPKDMPAADAGLPKTGLEDVTRKQADIQREKVASNEAAYGDISTNLSNDLQRVRAAADNNQGVDIADQKPWNAEAEAAKRHTDPIAAFGSFGSVFGILASAFTHAPMENALNASAAAMNAIRDGDAKSYDRAYQAWQDNTKLALDKHRVQHDVYQDAITLLNTNMAAGEAKLRVAAARFGDKQTLALLDAGLSKEAIDLAASRQRLATGLAEAQPKIMLENFKMSDLLNSGYDPKKPTDPKSVEALNQWKERWAPATGRSTPAEMFARKFNAEHPDATSAEFGDAMTNFVRAAKPTGAGASQNLTMDRQVSAAVAKKKEELLAQGKTEEEATRESMQYGSELRRTASAPSGNKIDDIQASIDRVGRIEHTIGQVEDLLKKHKLITGLGGKITRPGEIIGNVFGSNETDRKQFERYIAEIKENLPRALTGSNGRPLAVEAGNIDKIAAGLSLGDTTANTARAYKELRDELSRVKKDLAKRKTGNSAAPAPAEESSSGTKFRWQDAPVVQ